MALHHLSKSARQVVWLLCLTPILSCVDTSKLNRDQCSGTLSLELADGQTAAFECLYSRLSPVVSAAEEGAVLRSLEVDLYGVDEVYEDCLITLSVPGICESNEFHVTSGTVSLQDCPGVGTIEQRVTVSGWSHIQQSSVELYSDSESSDTGAVADGELGEAHTALSTSVFLSGEGIQITGNLNLDGLVNVERSSSISCQGRDQFSLSLAENCDSSTVITELVDVPAEELDGCIGCEFAKFIKSDDPFLDGSAWGVSSTGPRLFSHTVTGNSYDIWDVFGWKEETDSNGVIWGSNRVTVPALAGCDLNIEWMDVSWLESGTASE